MILATVFFALIAFIVLYAFFSSKNNNQNYNERNFSFKDNRDVREEHINNSEHPALIERRMNHRFSLDEHNFIEGYGGSIKLEIKGISFRPNYVIHIIKSLKKNEELILKKELDNPKDKYAVAIYTLNSIMLGYIPAYISYQINCLMDKEKMKCCFLSKSDHEIPYCYISLFYGSARRKNIESLFNDKWEHIDLKDTFKIRLGKKWSEYLNSKYKETISISGEYYNVDLYIVNEKFLTTDDKVESVQYHYFNNLSEVNLKKGKEAEELLKWEDAAKYYALNILINENLYLSALRLGIVYKKLNDYESGIIAIEKCIELLNIKPERFMHIDKLEKQIEHLKLLSTNVNPKKNRIERLRENIKRTEASVIKMREKGKEHLAIKAEKRLLEYNAELDILLLEENDEP